MTPIFTSQQGFYGPAPSGIDADYARSLPGGRGQGITVVDLEYDWYFAHEDLGLDASILLGGDPYTAWGDDHGTAVLGQLVARDNGYGVMGGVPDATIRVVSPWSNVAGYNPANAITTAAASMRAGDVLLIEQQTWGPNGTYVPVEWVGSVYDAIKLATQAGIVVVEPAGNGGDNLDGPEFGGRFDRSQYDSGAIIVGAGTPLREWLYLSSYGSRVDLQGWGANVATTGYGGLYGATKAEYYTGSFSGTSSAAPVVASAVAAVQSHTKFTRGVVLTPREVVDLLKRTGSAQAGDLTRPIGPLPNLRAALGSPSLTTAALNGPYGGGEGQAIAFSSAGSSAADGSPLTYRWSFGDGTVSTIANPSKTYADNGSYAVSLTVTDALGASSTASTTATIANLAPTATFTAPASIVEGSGYVVKLAGTDAAVPDRPTLLYALDCGLGQGYTAWSSTVKSVTCPVQPDQRAPLTVRGKVRDKDGGETEYTKSVLVTNAAPVVSFSATTATTLQVRGSLGVQFSLTDKGVNDGPWTFSIAWGDGTAKTTGALTAQGATASAAHTYTAPGTFNAQLSVTDKDGAITRSTKITVTVTR
jgi:PKD repeat protein